MYAKVNFAINFNLNILKRVLLIFCCLQLLDWRERLLVWSKMWLIYLWCFRNVQNHASTLGILTYSCICEELLTGDQRSTQTDYLIWQILSLACITVLLLFAAKYYKGVSLLIKYDDGHFYLVIIIFFYDHTLLKMFRRCFCIARCHLYKSHMLNKFTWRIF